MTRSGRKLQVPVIDFADNFADDFAGPYPVLGPRPAIVQRVEAEARVGRGPPPAHPFIILMGARVESLQPPVSPVRCPWAVCGHGEPSRRRGARWRSNRVLSSTSTALGLLGYNPDGSPSGVTATTGVSRYDVPGRSAVMVNRAAAGAHDGAVIGAHRPNPAKGKQLTAQDPTGTFRLRVPHQEPQSDEGGTP